MRSTTYQRCTIKATEEINIREDACTVIIQLGCVNADTYQFTVHLLQTSLRNLSWAMATFWRTFHHDGKISPAWRGEGHTPSPFNFIYQHEQSCGVTLVYPPTKRVDTLPLFLLYPYKLQEQY